jgi:hypothetical protein
LASPVCNAAKTDSVVKLNNYRSFLDITISCERFLSRFGGKASGPCSGTGNEAQQERGFTGYRRRSLIA